MKPLVVVDAPRRSFLDIPGTERISSEQYLTDPSFASGRGRKVFNLCRSLRYQSAGYYVSLLAEARGHRPLPSVEVLQDLKLAPVVKLATEELDALIQKKLSGLKSSSFELSIYFGHNLARSHDQLALALFNAFPAPLLRARFERSDRWRLQGIRVLGLAEVPEGHREFLVEQAKRYLKRAPRRARKDREFRYDLAILHDPKDPMPPSDAEALQRFVRAGESLGIRCTLIEKEAYGRVAEFDALFLRETTAVNHHTYRFARRAAAEGLVVIDDPASIARCTNKVYLAETLTRHRVATPKTRILSREMFDGGVRELGFPCVLKLPDSAFSSGVSRVDAPEALAAARDRLFANSELVVAQEYLPTSFDWRVGVLGGEALYVCRYGMAPGHWQIVNHAEGGTETGDAETLPVSAAPKAVVKLAVRAAKLIGDGLYGVDLKEIAGRPIVIEINDNPSLDSGIEDRVLGEDLYLRIMTHFLERIESR